VNNFQQTELTFVVTLLERTNGPIFIDDKQEGENNYGEPLLSSEENFYSTNENNKRMHV